jgi:hypothetical protein
MDSHGRPTFNLVNKKTHDLSDIISSFKEFKIEKFSILNSSGEIYFESAGGLPQWSNFSLPIEKKPHLLMIKTSDGKVYKKFL